MRDVIELAKQAIRGKNLRIVLPEGDDHRIRDAAAQLTSENLATTIVYGEDVPPAQPDDIALVLSRR